MVNLNIRFGGTISGISRIISGATEKFNTEYDLQSINRFVAQQTGLGSANRGVQQAVEKTKANIKWMAENYSILEKWLANLQETSYG